MKPQINKTSTTKRVAPLKQLYENFWVPVFGRILMTFSSWIEGKDLRGVKQTYDLREKEKTNK